ncbi:MAG: PepSY domain-containing protein, partial [Clostridia bacterium]|nr:PepSY domain-containing protein [Clostridia bacterium]
MKEGLLKEETPDSQPENLISKEEALTIVLNKVSGATEANTEIELDYDDGYWKYEGEIHHNGKEYE